MCSVLALPRPKGSDLETERRRQRIALSEMRKRRWARSRLFLARFFWEVGDPKIIHVVEYCTTATCGQPRTTSRSSGAAD